MENLIKALQREISELERIERAAEDDLKDAPNGTLRIAKKNHTEQYYWRTDKKDRGGQYIRKNEEEFIKKLAQKEYAQKIRALLKPLIERGKKELQKLQAIDLQEQITEIYEKYSPSRKKLIVPYLDTEKEYAEKWMQEKKRKKEGRKQAEKVPEIDTEIYTERGECVRSKSEKILADKLYMRGIPYEYEVPLYVTGYGHIRPDFTVLNTRTRKEFYWEHLGMMDDKAYCEKAIKKIETLERNGILPGKNLILTYETRAHPMNMKIVEKFVDEYLI